MVSREHSGASVVVVVVIIVIIGAGPPHEASLELLPLPPPQAVTGCVAQHPRSAVPPSKPSRHFALAFAGMTQLDHGSWAAESLTGEFHT